MAKKQTDPAMKVVVIIIAVVGGLALAVIVAAVIIMFFVRGSMYSNGGGASTGTNSIEQNNAIINQAIEQKDPSLCDQINGETSVSMPLPGGNKVQTYDEATSKQRCKQQAEVGQPYVY